MGSRKSVISINTSNYLKGIAMVMVILSHYAEWGFDRFSNSGTAAFLEKLGDYGVGVFFLLSGYGLYTAYGGKKTHIDFLKKRFFKIYLPYVIMALFISAASGGLTKISSLFGILFGIDYWFMLVIFLLYISFFLAGRNPKYTIIIETGFVIGLSVYFAINHYQIFWYDAIWTFPVGMTLAYLEKRFVKKDICIDIEDYMFSFVGKRSLYIYIIHGALYWKICEARFLNDSRVPWEFDIVFIIALTVVSATVLNLVFDFLINSIIKMRRERINEAD